MMEMATLPLHLLGTQSPAEKHKWQVPETVSPNLCKQTDSSPHSWETILIILSSDDYNTSIHHWSKIY